MHARFRELPLGPRLTSSWGVESGDMGYMVWLALPCILPKVNSTLSFAMSITRSATLDYQSI